MQAVQSAMAIRRQRHRREEQQRAKARRRSSLSDHLMSPDGFSPRGSVISLDARHRAISSTRRNLLDTKVMGTITTFHVGIVFIMMGLMCVISSLVPGYINRDWRELLATGCFLIFIGVLLTIINRIVASKEEEKFTRYISKKLAPPKIHHPVKLVDHHVRAHPHEPHHEHAEATSPTSPAHLECIVEELPESDKQMPSERTSTFRQLNEVAPVHHHHKKTRVQSPPPAD
jgi:hypothetical protein